MRYVHSVITFAVLSLLAILGWSSLNPDHPLVGALINAGLWIIAVALFVLALALFVRGTKRG